MKDLKCPYCDAELYVNHHHHDYEEDIKHQMKCPKCEKQFIYEIEVSISYYYEPKKADCLNNGKCDWKITSTSPKEFSRMICSMCDSERELTDKERKEFGIGPKESYFESI